MQPLPKLGSHVTDLNRLLEENERRQRRERLTLIRVWEELRGLGYEGGYDAVRCGAHVTSTSVHVLHHSHALRSPNQIQDQGAARQGFS